MAEEDDEASFEKLADDLEEVINLMHYHMGRFPTQDEVVRFVWGDEQEREAILARE